MLANRSRPKASTGHEWRSLVSGSSNHRNVCSKTMDFGANRRAEKGGYAHERSIHPHLVFAFPQVHGWLTSHEESAAIKISRPTVFCTHFCMPSEPRPYFSNAA